MPVLNQIVRYVTPRFFFKKNLTQVYADPEKITEDLITRYYELARREGNRQAFIERAKVNSKSNYEQLSKIKNPTLIQWGRQDTWIPLNSGQRFAKDLPNNELIIYENAGHVPMEEIPEKTAEDALTFLKK
jgi:pimeloyl-ACP methyl ester carboxylesterase